MESLAHLKGRARQTKREMLREKVWSIAIVVVMLRKGAERRRAREQRERRKAKDEQVQRQPLLMERSRR